MIKFLKRQKNEVCSASGSLIMAALNPSRSTDYSIRVCEANEAGEKFVELFYETVDRRRSVMSGFYADNSFLVWNGHTKSGAADITSFYQSLPGTEHRVLSFDCQPVIDVQPTVLVCCEGTVKYDGRSQERFSQNFLLTKMGEVWKVGSDCFRFIDKS